MKLTLKTDKRLIEDIRLFCKMNEMNFDEYVTSIIRKQFNLDRYGDLNEKLNIEEKVVKPVTNIVDEGFVKVVQEEVVEEINEPKVVESEEKIVKTDNVVKKRTRQLKAK